MRYDERYQDDKIKEYADQSIDDLLSEIQNTIKESEQSTEEFVYQDHQVEPTTLQDEPIAISRKKDKPARSPKIKIESVLNIRTFLFVASSTVLLGLYIYNVISINRLAGETEYLKQKLRDQKSVNVVLESRLNYAQRIEKISDIARKKLGLSAKAELPELIELN